ncbi:type I polyketide synthase [Amycolatopsis sp. Hca4]|uniref:type I polyketide synthase n=1 Tax=Amycolatopsis sp. Hca4 TaxID=2742131 RepID=UPI00158FF195|nr:type I polyketide synthase [Amycolatopsis sp. Hca4]QKV74031.1 SDR family NAD(P)-dependent oxidoreductase [Amycolatopsis sp. Hca4]
MSDKSMSPVGSDAVAVIGLSCRLPQAADHAAFWRLLAGGTDAITEATRWDAGPAGGEDGASPGRARTRWGGFLDDVDQFDAGFFGISPREAAAMDPQQRLMLELSWEALEHAGIVPATLAGRPVGVFVGAFAADYATVTAGQGTEAIGHHTVTGLNRGLIANRLSYALGLRGPSFTIDSAQSSALVAVHVACGSLRSGECETALVGGVHLNLVPESALAAAEFGGLSPDGRCRTFDARANGYVRGEGGGVVLLKPLARALADGDTVHCVIRGSAVNNDGAGAGLTVPDAGAQEAVLRHAYERAGVDPAEVQYVELHGTGTQVGDPVEARALGAVFGPGRTEPLRVGSVKTNIGHLEGAAGMAGLLKTVLSIGNGALPPTLHHEHPHPGIPLAELGLRVQTRLSTWDVPAGRRLAGVSSFGMGGTNCHVVLAGWEGQQAAPQPVTTHPAGHLLPWVLSAKTPAALTAQAARLLEVAGDFEPAGVAERLLASRTLFGHRAVFFGRDRETLLAGLAGVAQGLPGAQAVVGEVVASDPVFVFPGQGAQWVGMGRELLDAAPVFAESVARCERALAPHVDWSLGHVLRTGELLDRVDVVQPATWAVMVSLAALWRSFGVVPRAVVGGSQGEIAAAAVAGVLSLEDAATVVAVRSRVIARRLAGGGTMAFVARPADEVRAQLPSEVAVAVVNSPAATVIAGPPEQVQRLVDDWQQAGVRAKRIPVDYASHSPQVDTVREELLELLADVRPQTADIPFYSTVDCAWTDRLDAAYWVRNLREPVRFADAVRDLLDTGARLFVESSSHPVLVAAIEDTAAAAGVADAAAIGSLHRDEGGLDRFLTSAAGAFVRGVDIDWNTVLPARTGTAVRACDLPTYAFQRTRHWIEATGAPVPAPVPGIRPQATEVSTVDLVRAQASVVLRTTADAIDPKRTFKQLGFDSVMAVELRNRLNAVTGKRLPTTAVYDHPTPATLARVLGDFDGPPADAPATTTAPAAEADPVVIVGMGCRLPGGVSSADDLWRLVAGEVDAVGGFPADRGWDPGAVDGDFARRGGFLSGAADFDAEFFGISPREALAMDPQQRLLLETSWEALEHAGTDPESLRGSRTGVFVGAMAGDYGPRLHEATDTVAGYVLTGAAGSVVSGRVAYALGLEGPAVSVDTACSSSLVALHLAVQALRSGECTLALAGGATVMSTPGMFAEFSRQAGLAADGRCKAFSADADGTGWSEGIAVLVVEKLSDARRHGHRVLAVVRGSAVNSDGASNGLTAPNGPSQQRVISAALADAGLSASDVDVVEAHGTGTELGDPVEANALLATYGQDRDRPLWLGSLKSNLGHTQAAAGIAGVIKMVLAMRHGVLPKTLHVTEPSPHVDWNSGAIELLTEPRAWDTGGVRRAAVSSFGISGTNAHVVLEQGDPVPAGARSTTAVPWVLGAKTPAALSAQARRLHAFLEDHPELGTADIGLTLATRRTAFEHRAVVPGGDLDALAKLARGDDTGREVARPGGTAFLFSGEGAQRLGMGRGLHAAYPAFARAFDAVVAELDRHLARPLREVMWGYDADALERTEFAQPALFAVEVALFRLLEHWEVRPDHVSGHSIGEIAAAHVAGVLSLADAARLVAARGRLMQELPGGGAMVAVEATLDEVRPQTGELVSVAAVNGPAEIVLSGAEAEVLALAAGWTARGRRTRRLPVSHAFHSPLMAPMLAEFGRVAAELDLREPVIPVVSNLAGATGFDAAHWVRHVTDAVMFAQGVDRLRESGVTRFLEVGPDGVLTVLAQDSLDGEVAIASLRRDLDEPAALAAALGRLHAAGGDVGWTAYFAGAQPVDLPPYAFQHERFWLAPSAGGAVTAAGLTEVRHPLLSAAVPLEDGIVLTGRLGEERAPWLPEHCVGDTAVLPGTAVLEMVLCAAGEAGFDQVGELVLLAPLVVPADVRVRVRGDVVEVHSQREGESVLHATGSLSVAASTGPVTWAPRGEAVALDDLYAELGGRGLAYGPTFRGLRSVRRDEGELFVEAQLPVDGGGHLLHPALLDAVLHPLAAGHLLPDTGTARVPFTWSGVRVHASGASALRVRLTATGPDSVALVAWDPAGGLVLDGALVLRPVDAERFAVQQAPLYRMTWEAAELTTAGAPGRRVDVEPSSVRDGLARTLELVQSWLAEPHDGPLVLVTRDAETDPAQAAVWGLVRSAQTEHPGRFRLIDLDGDPASLAALPAVLTAAEPQVSVRAGEPQTPRLTKVTATAAEPGSWAGSSLLVTGAGGVIASAVARHAVRTRNIGHVVLVSRRGEDNAAVGALAAELRDLGAAVSIEACDVTDRGQLAAVLGRVPAGFPLRGVFHAAGAVADTVVRSLTPAGLDAVLAAKVDAVTHLDELTRDLDLEWFVTCSSVAGWWGTAGQANYAAANNAVDALVRRRHADGYPALSLAWGLWEERSELSAHLGRADLQRLARVGILPLGTAEALSAFEAALAAGDEVLAPAEVNVRDAVAGALPPFLAPGRCKPVRAKAAAAVAAADTARVTEVVSRRVAAVLGRAALRDDQLDQAFSTLGIDSLTTLELRNELTAATGVPLAPTVLFDHPTPNEVIAHLCAALGAQERDEEEAAGTVTAAAAGSDDDPIVIIGMGCRYPGGIATPQDLWDLVARGGEGVTPFPADRGWDLDTLFGDPDHPGSCHARAGGFLHEAAEFDAAFFGISPREALATDPQQRLLLETAWEAVERSGIDPRSLRGSRTGVFAGVMYHDYATRLREIPAGLAGFLTNGSLGSVASGRVSYVLGLEGPSVSVDTACSSSLVALHLAAQALRQDECELALVGGVTVMSTPNTFVDFSRQRALAPDGRCKAFSASADGTGWAEGVGVLVVERLSAARRNGHQVLAVVRGTAINSDGASNGLTAPSGQAQQRVIRQALADAGLPSAAVDVVEAHGTGTALGDPIEAGALVETYGRERTEPLWLGSFKSNIGHSQAAAGVGGVIKMVMAMRHGVMPKTLHVDEPSPHVDWSAGAVELLTEARAWPRRGGVRRAAVSSFGISGTNAHVIIEQPAAPEEVSSVRPSEGAVAPWVLSGRTEAAVAGQAAKLLAHLDVHPATGILDVAHALLSRSVFEHRAVLLGDDLHALVSGLEDVAHGRPGPDVVTAPAGPSAGGTAFLFAGQGSQRAGMGRELHAAFPAFAAAFDEVCAKLDRHLPRPLRGVVFEDVDALSRTEFTQPGLFALEVALFRLAEAGGLRPAVLAGHSIGEIAAAHVAGVLSLADACTLVAARGRLMQQLPAGGVMVAVQAPEHEVAALLAGHEAAAGIAAVNGPSATVLSGAEAVVTGIAEQLRDRGYKTRALPVSHAFHSPLMAPMLDAFRAVAERLEYHEPGIPLVSTVTGRPAGPGDFTTAGYWVRHVREAVRFHDAVRAIEAQEVRTFLELGPDGVLTALAAGCLADAGTATLLPSLRKGRPENRTVLEALARLHVRGIAVGWAAVLPGGPRRDVDLPTYAFQHERFWLDVPEEDADVESMGLATVGHPLLGAAVPLPDGGALLTGKLSGQKVEWTGDHRVGGAVVVPGTALLEMATRAGEEVGCARVEELVFFAPLVLSPGRDLGVQVQVSAPEPDGWRKVGVFSRPEGGEQWTEHATGVVRPRTSAGPEAPAAWPPAGAVPVGLDGLYERLAESGLDYGPAFRGLRAAWRSGDDVYAEVALPEPADAGRYLLHPALLDAALHPLVTGELRLPFSWNGAEVHATGVSELRVRLRTTGPDSVALTAWDTTGTPVLTADRLALRAVGPDELRAIAARHDDVLFRVGWEPVRLPSCGRHSARVVPVPAFDPAAPVAPQVRTVLVRMLADLQAWVADERGGKLALVTRNAQADPVQAALGGLVRTVQTEHPGRLQLIDVDGTPQSDAALAAAIASDEPQVQLRGGTARVPRLVRAADAAHPDCEPGAWAAATLLVTGAGGVVGSALARHAVTEYGVGHVVLTSRRGAQAPGMPELAAHLRALGAEVTVEDCDAADRDQVRAVLERIPDAFPLRGVVHAAGVSRDRVFTAMTEAELDAVLPAKVDAVANLDELTRGRGLTWFVVCSSAAGAWGNAGQANYAAANSAIDALAVRRRAAGEHAVSLAWGLWEERSELSGHLDHTDLARLSRLGFAPLATGDALAAFDTAVRLGEPVLLPFRLDTRNVSESASAPLTPLLRNHVRKPIRPAGHAETEPRVKLADVLAGQDEGERRATLERLVRTEVAEVLGHADAAAVPGDRGFFEIGFDSLTSLELRNRVEKASGLSLPPTVVFDHSTPGALAAYLRSRLVVAEVVPEPVGSVKLTGMTVLLTGATGGLGRVFAGALADAGANLVLTGRSGGQLDELASTLQERGTGVLAVSADVTDRDAPAQVIAAATTEFGAVDALVNNAGVAGPVGPMWETDEAEWWHAMSVNLRGSARVIRAALPGMLSRRSGRIVNVVSSAGKHRWPTLSGYSVSKGAIIKLTDNLAPELAGSGVAAFSYHPGLVDVGITGDQLRRARTRDRHLNGIGDWLADQRDGGRFTEPERAAVMLLRLLSGEADALSGSYLTPEDDLTALLGRRER